MKLLKIALYARVSTFNGQDPELQLRELREYAQVRGLMVHREYVDKGWSGSKDLDGFPVEEDSVALCSALVVHCNGQVWAQDYLESKYETLLGLIVTALINVGCEDSEAIRQTRAHINEDAGQFVLQNESAAIISAGYFDGKSVLFHDSVQHLSELRSIVGALLRDYRLLDRSNEQPLDWKPICEEWLPHAFVRADRIEAACTEFTQQSLLGRFVWSYRN